MKAGDLVKWNNRICLVTETYESKCWRTDKMGKAINWKDIELEPFARILVDGTVHGIPQLDMSVLQ